MGILKGIIDRFRAMGKTENEILSIVEAAADKATVNPDVAKNENPQKPEIKIETTAEAFVEAVLQMGTTLQQAKTAILKMSSLRDAENRKNTNNWRKMHGLPMNRQQTGRQSTKALQKKKEYKRPEIKVETSAEQFVEAVMQTGVTAEQVKTAIMKMCDSQRCTNRQNTNNWRKMHGLPMRRKQKARKKHERGKRADSH